MESGQEDDETTGRPMNTKPMRSPHSSSSSSSAYYPDRDQLCCSPSPSPSSSSSAAAAAAVVRLTIWCKSLLFNCNGYTVFDDSSGKMVFRVDDYACNRRDETFLMDFTGKVLLTIRRCKKKLSIMESWEAYRGDHDILSFGGRQLKPLIRATKDLGHPSCKIWVANAGDRATDYWMNWSRQKGWLKIYRATCGASPVAEVNRKCGAAPDHTQLGKDVLTLSMQRCMDQAMIMAMIMINNAMRLR